MKLTKTLILFAAMVGSSYGATISVDMASSTAAALPGGTGLSPSYTWYLGTYTGGALTTSSTFADINSGFSILASGAFASGDTAGYAGYFTSGAINFTDAAGFGGDPLYVWFSNGSNANALITGFSPAIPLDAAIPNSVDYAINGTNAPTLTYVLGTYDAQGTNQLGSGGNIILNVVTPIPEPSAALLGAIGALGLLRRRRI